MPIVYGLVRFPPEYLQAHGERFPFANEVAYSGCRAGPGERTTVIFCEGCRQELRNWRERARQ